MWPSKRLSFLLQAAIYLERTFAAAWEFNNAQLTTNGCCNARLDILAENKYIVTEHFAYTFMMNVFSTCQIC